MANIHIHPWDETPGEKSLRVNGHRASKRGILEAGLTVSAKELREPGELLKKIAKTLHAVKNKAADLSWDDEKVCIAIGIQMRNDWEQGPDGDWYERGSTQWLDEKVKRLK